MIDLTGRVAIVTGGAKGIGRATALLLAKRGAKVVINYRGSREAAEAVAAEIEAMGTEAMTYCCDVADMAACNEMTEAVMERFKRIDILVNNAGITRDNLLLRMTEEEFDAVIAANLKGCYNMMRLVSKIMLRQKYGRIISLSSVSGVYGNAGQVNYSASKAAIIGMTKSAAKELASRNITCNAVAPGFIETDMTDAIPEAARESLLAGIPAKRPGKPEEVASAIAFLASEEAAYITGQVLLVSGGM